MPRRKTVLVEDDDPARPITWRELLNRPAQVIINAMAILAFSMCIRHFF